VTLRRLVLLLFIFPLADLALLLWLASALSWQWAIVLLLGSAALGLWLLRSTRDRWQGSLRDAARSPELLASGVFDEVLLLLAAVLLLLPGPVGDLLGLLLLIPAVRRTVRRGVVAHLLNRLAVAMIGDAEQREEEPSNPRSRAIDVEVVAPAAEKEDL
jgi:UPF0716 protein FxsA